jgi:hypothetical protein
MSRANNSIVDENPIGSTVSTTILLAEMVKEGLIKLVTIVMIVRTYSIAVELRDNAKDNSPEAIGLATFSNSKSIQVRLASKRRGS